MAFPGGIARVRTIVATRSARAAAFAGSSSRSPAGAAAPQWHIVQRFRRIAATCASVGTGAPAVASSSGSSTTASAIVATIAAATAHHARTPLCQRLKTCRTSTSTPITATRTSHARVWPYVSGKCPASIAKTTGSVR